MDSMEHVEEERPVNANAASATAETSKEMTEETSLGPATRKCDKYESRLLSAGAEQDTGVTGSDGCSSSVDQESHTGFQQEHAFNHSGSMSDDPDLGQLYQMSAQRFMGADVNQEYHYDDLPLVFSLPNSEEDSTKVYSCNICNFKTAFKNSLVNHQAVHSDARPWVCDVCDYAAKRKQDLKKHLQTMHGMIVDSLSLRPGANPQTSCVSSSGASSPVDTKPVIVNNTAVSSEKYSSGTVGQNNSHSTKSSSFLVQQQTAAGFRQPLASSAKLDTTPRSVPMPVIGKVIADQFPFNNNFWGAGRTTSKLRPGPSAETFLSRFSAGLREEVDADHVERDTSGLENFFLQKLRERPRERGLSQGSSEKLSLRNVGHVDSQAEGQLPPVAETLSTHRMHHSSVTDVKVNARDSIDRCSKDSDGTDNEALIRSDAPALSVASSSHSEGMTMGNRWKRTALDSTTDKVSAKMAKFHSSASDFEHCPQVSSQSDHSGNAEPISSTESYSHGQENRKSFHCLHCDILFFENALYLMHMGLHDNSNPWKCSICGRTFFEKYSFTSHFINQH